MTDHAIISFFKSLLRIAGCLVAGLSGLELREAGICEAGLAIIAFAGLFLFAELFGIAEELPGTYKGTEINDTDKQ